MQQNCADCWYNDYDEELDMEVCRMDLDEDEVYRIYTDATATAPISARETIIRWPGGNKGRTRSFGALYFWPGCGIVGLLFVK